MKQNEYHMNTYKNLGQHSELTRSASIEVAINYSRQDFYYAGPPTLIYVIAPNGIEYRTRLLDLHGISSNEVKKYPRRFNIRVSGPLPRAPYDTEKPVLTGELVRLPSKAAPAGNEDLRTSESREITGGSPGSDTVTRINLGRSDVSISENGKIDMEVDGESIFTADSNYITTARDITQYSFCGGMRRVLIRENMIANLIPTTFATPYPMYIPDFAFFNYGRKMISNVTGLMKSLR